MKKYLVKKKNHFFATFEKKEKKEKKNICIAGELYFPLTFLEFIFQSHLFYPPK